MRGMAPDRSKTTLLIVDLISDFEFPGGSRLMRAALPVARRIARLKMRAKAAGVPVIYVNDNFGRWRSDFPAMVRQCSQEKSRGAAIVKLLSPDEDDYCVLKPKHSGFFATALGTLLEYIGSKNLVLTGLSSNQCVLFTANDAYVRDLKLHIPRDCIASLTVRENRHALQHFKTVLGAKIDVSTRINFGRH